MSLFPSLSAANPAYVRGVNAKSPGKFGVALVGCPDLLNVGCSKSTVPVVGSVVVPTFLRCVLVVLGFGSKRKMKRVHASGVVAKVHDDHSVRNLSSEEFPRVSMCPDLLFTRHQKDPVSVSVLGPGPFPANAGLVYPGLENIDRGQNRELSKIARVAFLVVARATQLASNGFAISTHYALQFGSRLVGHSRSGSDGRIPIVCHFHGRGTL